MARTVSMAQPRKVYCCIYYDCSLFVVVVAVALSSESEDIGTYPLEFFEPVFGCGFCFERVTCEIHIRTK